MGTKIPWCDETINPIKVKGGGYHCTKTSPGCDNCYAEKINSRFGNQRPFDNSPVEFELDKSVLLKPVTWRKPKKIFIQSMGDVFHENVPDSFIKEILFYVWYNRKHTFIILTKRPERIAGKGQCSNCGYLAPVGDEEPCPNCGRTERQMREAGFGTHQRDWPKNLWIGVTAENQVMADLRIPILLSIPAAVRFVSVEPMLGHINIAGYLGWNGLRRMGDGLLYRWAAPKIDWVICGGETGPHARPMHPDWVRNLRDQCQAAGVPFFFKSWGEWAPVQRNNDSNQVYIRRDGLTVTAKKFACLDKQGRDVLDLPGLWDEDDVDMAFVGKKAAGDILDGRQYHEFPEVTR